MKLRQIAAAAVCAAAAANSFILPAAAEQEWSAETTPRGYCWTTRRRIPRRTGRS